MALARVNTAKIDLTNRVVHWHWKRHLPYLVQSVIQFLLQRRLRHQVASAPIDLAQRPLRDTMNAELGYDGHRVAYLILTIQKTMPNRMCVKTDASKQG